VTNEFKKNYKNVTVIVLRRGFFRLEIKVTRESSKGFFRNLNENLETSYYVGVLSRKKGCR